MSKKVSKAKIRVEDKRGDYSELCGTGVDKALSFLSSALPETVSDFDRKGRGYALNHDLYAWDGDLKQGIVQIREATRQCKNWFLSVKKTYVFCGFHENGDAYSHKISSQKLRGAIRRGLSSSEIVSIFN
ncbi:hypothetical protein [Gluconobacter cerinus]|uniref:hypothetical protein n=1 Tax=Gluconobacter cerinus TaxID=38307 RepID=UPI001B8D3414|nr:hypothetical protein [Gluconobacter cerinus]MBS1038085.1 hypothetical protein [Gluconobacter cerinus]